MVFKHQDQGREAEVSAAGRYTLTAIALHWIVAGIVLFQIGYGWYLDGVPRGTLERAIVVNLHKSIGVTAGLLVCVLLWWRTGHPAPAFPGSMPKWEARLAKWGHAGLYACMVLVPLSGYLASNFSRYGVKYFGLVTLAPWGADNKSLYALLNGAHVVTSYVFVALIAAHVLAVLKHALVDRDATLQRMLPRVRSVK